MIKNKKLKNKNTLNKIEFLILAISFLIITFKTLLGTFISEYISLIPSILIIIWFIVMFFKKLINFKYYDLFLLIMFIVGIISGLIHNHPVIAILYQIKSLGIYYLLFMIIRNKYIDSFVKTKFLKIINTTTFIIIIFAIVEVLFSKAYLFPQQWISEIVFYDNFIRAYSLICNPNLFGFYLLSVFIINKEFNLNFLRTKKGILYIILIFLGIIISVSRSAIIFTIVIMLIYFIVDLRKNKTNLFHLKKIFLFVLIIAITSVGIYKINNLYLSIDGTNRFLPDSDNNNDFSNNVDNNLENNNVDTSNDLNEEIILEETFLTRIASMFDANFLLNSLNNGRLAIINYGISIWQKNIFLGTGFSSFLSASSFLNENIEATKLGLTYADNQYIVILVETGIIGVLSLLIFLILFIKNMFKNHQNNSILFTFLVMFFGLFINVLEVQLIMLLYFVFIGMCELKENIE